MKILEKLGFTLRFLPDNKVVLAIENHQLSPLSASRECDERFHVVGSFKGGGIRAARTADTSDQLFHRIVVVVDEPLFKSREDLGQVIRTVAQ